MAAARRWVRTGASRLPGQGRDSARSALSGPRDGAGSGRCFAGAAAARHGRDGARGGFRAATANITSWTGGAEWLLA